ncbi:AAA family ATPase, partial [Acinetobacter pittii]
FIATMIKNGYVRKFLSSKNYIDESFDKRDDITTTLNISIRVEQVYVNRIQDALKEEERGDGNTFRTSPYHLTLESFIHSIVDNNYEFDEPLLSKIKLSYENFFKPNFVESDENFFDSIITFFTQAADNDYFFDKPTAQLNFKNDLFVSDLSDGEYQILFIYALLDLFDDEDTLFLLDEVDSHLHYKNIEQLWAALHSIKGYTLTTTHLLDSITSPLNSFDNLKIVDKGIIHEDRKIRAIIERLSNLSRMESVNFEVCSKLDNIVLMDDYNDWTIFLALAGKKQLDISKISKVHVIKQASSYGSINEILGKAKIEWVNTMLSFNLAKAKNIFMICDRDEAKINFKEDGVSVAAKNELLGKINKNKKINIHLLAWQRREIKNYLLSYTALSKAGLINEINNCNIAQRDFLRENDPGDNNSIRNMNVKSLVTNLIDTDGIGLDIDKLNHYIDNVPSLEISKDIEDMYNFIVEKLS